MGEPTCEVEFSDAGFGLEVHGDLAPCPLGILTPASPAAAKPTHNASGRVTYPVKGACQWQARVSEGKAGALLDAAAKPS